jgi:tRNA pseudouridine-54 N-methylase
MATEVQRIKVNKNTHIEMILEAARDRAVIIEMNGFAYRVNPVGDTSSPFTAETAYASVKTVDGRSGAGVSNEEIEDAIRQANEDSVRHVVEQVGDSR